MTNSRAGRVLMRGEACGVLFELESGGARFRYDAEWVARGDAEPISRALPVRAEAYDSRTLHAFFLGLLPEGWLFDLALAKLKLSPGDPFGLVLALCRDCVGAVSVVPLEAADGLGLSGREAERG